MDSLLILPRPKIGDISVSKVLYHVCTYCHYLINDNLCAYDCPLDGDDLRPAYLEASYEVTEKFLGDKLVKVNLNEDK